ncbi:MAG: hypothetical protein ACR2PL_22605 [Dehalococcoidia bacterium]
MLTEATQLSPLWERVLNGSSGGSGEHDLAAVRRRFSSPTFIPSSVTIFAIALG